MSSNSNGASKPAASTPVKYGSLVSSQTRPRLIRPTSIHARHADLGYMKLRQLFEGDDSFASSLLVAVWDLFGPECQDWDIDIFAIEIPAATGAHLSEDAKDKLAAAMFLLGRDDFYHDVDVFVNICNVLSGSGSTWTDFDPADAFEVAWGINEAMLIYPPTNPEDPFSEEIKGYIRRVTESEGFSHPPDVLKLGYTGHQRPDPLASLADNPVAYEAFAKNKYQETQDFLADLEQRWAALIQQIMQLPIRNGTLKNFLAELKKGISVKLEPRG